MNNKIFAQYLNNILPDSIKTIIHINCKNGELIDLLNKKGYNVSGISFESFSLINEKLKDVVLIEKYPKINIIDKCTDLVILTDIKTSILKKDLNKIFKECGRLAKKHIIIFENLTDYNLKEKAELEEKIKKNIKGKINNISILENYLILKLDLKNIAYVEDFFVPLANLSNYIKSYETVDDFYNYRDIVVFQHYNPIKNLGYKNFLDNTDNPEKILLIGAGSGFSENIKLIKQLKSEGYSLWGCNHIAEGLLENGIKVDYMFGTESREILKETLFKKLSREYTYPNIVLHPASHPYVLLNIKAKNKWYYLAHDPENKLFKTFLKLNKEKSVFAHGSVSGYMLEMAYLLNPRKIKTIGYDFIIRNNLPYDKTVKPLNKTKKGQLIYKLKYPCKAVTNGIEYTTTRLYKKFAGLIGVTIARYKILKPNVEFERLGYSPLSFNYRDDDFKTYFKKISGKDYEEFLEKYSLIDILNVEWRKEKVEIPLDAYTYYLIPDKILNFQQKYSKEEMKFIKKRIIEIYEEGKIIIEENR